MRPMHWHRKRTKLSMPLAAELTLDMLSCCERPLRVSDIVHLAHQEEIASVATIYSGLKWLLAHRFLTLTTGTSSTSKVHSLTFKARKYLGIEEKTK